MQKKYRITVQTNIFIVVSAIALLPTLGGIMEIFTHKLNELSLIHLFCFLVYLSYFIWFVKIISQRVILSKDMLSINSLISEKALRWNEIEDIVEIKIPKKTYFKSQMFDEYVPYLRITSSKKRFLICALNINNYNDFKLNLEIFYNKKIETIIKKKTLLYKIADLRM